MLDLLTLYNAPDIMISRQIFYCRKLQIFIKNKQNIDINQLIAEIPLVTKQFIEDTKNINADLSGEIKFQNIRTTLFQNKQIKVTKDGILWIIGGNLIKIPN